MPVPIGTPIAELERLYWQAIKDKNVQNADELTHYPCIITGARGVANVADSAAFAAMMNSATWTLHDFTLSNWQANGLNDTTVVLAYTIVETLTVDGQSVTLTAYDSSVWVKDVDGRFRCALHTEAIAGDSFGRDRKG